jgi:hypothetical protein
MAVLTWGYDIASLPLGTQSGLGASTDILHVTISSTTSSTVTSARPPHDDQTSAISTIPRAVILGMLRQLQSITMTDTFLAILVLGVLILAIVSAFPRRTKSRQQATLCAPEREPETTSNHQQPASLEQGHHSPPQAEDD